MLLLALFRLGPQSTNLFLWIGFTFVPLIIVAYYLDLIVGLIGRGWLGRRHPALLVLISWMIMYPLVWIPSNYTFSALVGMNAEFNPSSIPFLIFLGLIFGLYYYIGYIYVYRTLKWISKKMGRQQS